MIKKHVLLSILGLFIACTVGAQDNSMADEKAIVKSGNMRFTVLTPEMIRIEYSAKLQFEDRASFVVINRHLPVPNFTQEERDGYLYLTTDKLELRYKLGTYPVSNDRCNPNLQITLDVNGVEEVWYPGKQDPYNLKGTTRTLDRAEGDVREWLENGLLSRVGWAVIDEREPRKDGSLSLMFERDTNGGMDWVAQRKDTAALDMYFMGYGHDYKKALGDFTKIAGKIPLPPLYVFGYWYSKFQCYTEQDMRDIVNEIRLRDIPMDVLVIDMDWHRNGKTGSTDGTEWTGWSWNKALFPDPAGFISWLHDEQNLNTTLNLHPADGVFPKEDNYDALYADLAGRYSDIKADSLTNEDGTIRWNIENKDFYKAFFEHILRPHENIGVDFWWVDWQQWMIAQNEPNLGNTFWLNHVFFNDKKLQAKNRPFIFHRWGGLGNHRYPIGFSGDSEATFSSLAFQPYFTATASNVGYGYWSHDIGGHNQEGANDAELYLRWIQYGVFSPILRTHATAAGHIERRIWKYANFEQMRDAIYLRYALIPYIYTMARWSYDTGVGMCRPMYYDYPEDERAYTYSRQYMFGDNILVAPIGAPMENGVSDVKVWLPAGNDWYEWHTGTLLNGGQELIRQFSIEEYPIYVKAGAVIPMYGKEVNSLDDNPKKQIIGIFPGAAGEFSIYEDAGNDQRYVAEYATTRVTSQLENRIQRIKIAPREGHYRGMNHSKDYLVRLYGAEMPRSVSLNGMKVNYTVLPNSSEWSYCGKEFMVSIPISNADCNKSYEIVVEFDKANVVDVNDGMIKQLKTLHRAIANRKFKYAGNYVVPEVTGFCSETNLKVSYDPDNFCHYINYFKTHFQEAMEITLKDDLVSPFAK